MGKKGLDLCYHQGDVNWAKAKADGVSFIIPRDGWGMDDLDPKLIQNSKEALAAGIEVQGVYHFVYGINVSEAIKNADRAIANVKKAGLPKSTVIWCDIEQDTIDNARDYRGVNLTNKDLTEMAKAFCNRCLAEGYCTGIYLNADYLVNRYGQDIMYEYDIWFADPSGAFSYPCLIKQVDWYGRISGISVNVDVDEWIGTYTAGTAKPVAQQKKEETKKQEETTVSTNENLAFMAGIMPYVAYGKGGQVVVVLQKVLRTMGYYTSDIDGSCGPMTVSAIKALQTAWKAQDSSILVDGSFGPQCWAKLLLK